MAITYTTAAKTARMTATRDHFANGTLEIQNSGGTALAVYGFSASGGTISGGAWTITFDATTVSAVATGTASQAVIKTSGGVADLTGLTVATSGADVTLDNVAIVSGQDVVVNSAVITHAA